MAELFGYEFKKKTAEPVSFVQKQEDDGAVTVSEGGVYGTYVDMDGSIRTESELVNKYRDMSQHPEIDEAIDNIVNEAIVNEPETKVVELVLDDLEQPDRIKKMLQDEFDGVLRLLEFNELSYEVFKRWYVDGRLYYHAIVDESQPKNGITELRYVDPRKIRKIKEMKRKKMAGQVPVSQTASEYFIYNEKGFAKQAAAGTSIPSNSIGGIKIAKDSIVHCTSGLTSINGDLVLSYLHKAIRPLNQLRAMEDSLVIYRISRAPERRVFYIDVGNLPKMKAEQHLRDQMNRFKNKVVYDSATGEIRDDRKYMAMLEDFWLPRREGGRGTEITTLPGGQNLGQMDDVIYFQRRLYKSLSVPITRLDPEVSFNLGRSTEITRDEIKFAKFVQRLRNKFAVLFTKILEKQLILKGIITPEDWIQFKDVIKYKFAQDNYYAELKETEVLRDRIAMLRDIDDFAGKYYSHEWIRRHVLRQTDEEIEEINNQITKELSDPQYNPPMDPNAAGGDGGPSVPQGGGFPAPPSAGPTPPGQTNN
jgi:hypothetical protein